MMMNTTSCTDLLSPTDWTDLELLPRLLAKEGKAWREFHSRFDRLVYRCIHKVTNRFRNSVSDDDVQDIFAQFLVRITAKDFRKLCQFSPDRGTKLGTWLGMIATNVAWDHLRSVSRRPQCIEISDVHDQAAIASGPLTRSLPARPVASFTPRSRPSPSRTNVSSSSTTWMGFHRKRSPSR